MQGSLTGQAVRLAEEKEVARFFEEAELLEPGVVSASPWHPSATGAGGISEVDQHGDVA
ncbi:SAM-dependent methyltransferase [Nocardiopsis sp. LOL_012]|uniref:SAM-dependent methyltransferase n=1 Tax=Nocardiopsis sp. LOL_012 TaxID=3345409 RepID=UPI003A875556